MLFVCPACNRHVREETCPFCGSSVERRNPSVRPRRHATRAALAFGTAATAVGVTLGGCGAPALPYGSPAGQEQEAMTDGSYYSDASTYGLHDTGVPELDASATDAANDDAANDDGGTNADANDEASTDASDQ